jgi:hypothetical protein
VNDFQAFKKQAAGAGGDGGEPPDGNHTAALVRGSVIDTKNGTRVKFEWQTGDLAHYWESWHGVDGQAAWHTGKLLTALEIDTDTLTSFDELADKLLELEGRMFVVNVTRNGTFLNTKVLERAQGMQTAIPVEVPAQTPRSAIFDDDDIPF